MNNIKNTRPGKIAGALAAACLLVGTAGAAQAALQLNFQNIGGGFTGDGGQAKLANLNGPSDVVFDSKGNMYVSQSHGNRIRKITPTGAISTIAGGNNGFGGDGGLAINALIDQPWGMAVDASDNLYFVDYGNRRIRRIAPDGKITTIAGNGLRVDAGDGGTALKASFLDLSDLAIDKNGNMFVAEPSGQRIRKITAAGTISTYAGVGQGYFQGDGGPATAAYLNFPYAISVDGAGNLYIADTNNFRVRKIGTDGIINTFLDNQKIGTPFNVHADKSGNVFVSQDCRLSKFSSAGVLMTQYNGEMCARAPEGAPATSSGFGHVDGVVIDGTGNVFFVDWDYQRIAKIGASDGKLWTHAGVSTQIVDGVSVASAPMMSMNHVAVTDNGTVVVGDQLAMQVRTITGGKLYQFAGDGTNLASTRGYPCESDCGKALRWSFPLVAGLASGPGNVVYLVDRGSGVHRIAPDKSLTTVVQVGRDGARPWGVATDLGGNLYMADSDYNRIRKLDTVGTLTTIAGTGNSYDPAGDGGPALSAGIYRPSVIALDGGGSVYINDNGTASIRKIGRDGKIRRIAGNGQGGAYTGEGGLALDATLGGVGRMAVHPTGVYFTSGGKIRRIRPDARIETIAFPQYASALTVKYGYLYVTTANGTVQRAVLPRAVATADYDGDGKSDVLFRGAAGTNLVWLGANNLTRQPIAAMATENKLVGQGDFDGDGEVDLVWRNTLTGANTIWRSANSNTQMVIASQADQNWTIAGVGDFNGDGKADLFWRNKTTGANEYWPGAAAGSKKAVTAMADLKWIIAGFGDFDGDGRSDVLWRNTQTGANQAWPGLLASQALVIASVTNLNWKVAAIGDFNGDGASDIVWRDTTNGASAIWRSGNSAWRQSIVGVTNTQWSIAAAADYDNDGIDDLLWRNNVTGENQIWKNGNNATQKAVATAGNSWKVQPVNAQP